jgi:hypothetical protein
MLEYYRGRLDFGNAYHGTWDVQYDDGEWDMGLCRHCVHPFIPYYVGEELEWRDENDNFVKCQVVSVYNKDNVNISVDIKLLHNGQIMQGVLPLRLVRKLSATDRANILKPGAEVEALFPGDPDQMYYSGVVREDLGKGLYRIEYDDGDVAEVAAADIRPLME